MARESRSILWQGRFVSRPQREEILGQKGCVVWLTGLSGSGKSTIAGALERRLVRAGRLAYVLDGDNVRHGLCRDLGFGPEERDENIRRVGEVAGLFADAGLVTIVAFISPYRAGRDRARGLVPEGRFVEIHVDTPIEECEKRDPKGLYGKARSGRLTNFTGIDAPYEPPVRPELVLRTIHTTAEECAGAVEALLRKAGLLGTHPARSAAEESAE